MARRRHRRRTVTTRIVATSTGVVVVTAAGLVLGSVSSLGDVADALPMTITEHVDEAPGWSMDLPLNLDMAGLTRPAELAMTHPEPAPDQTGREGIEVPVPIQYDAVAMWRMAAEQRAYTADLRAQRPVLCDPDKPNPYTTEMCED